jgi:hypothetical protein
LNKHDRTQAHIAPLYPAIGRLCDLFHPSTHAIMRDSSPSSD